MPELGDTCIYILGRTVESGMASANHLAVIVVLVIVVVVMVKGLKASDAPL